MSAILALLVVCNNEQKVTEIEGLLSTIFHVYALN